MADGEDALTKRLSKASRKIHSVSDSLVNFKLVALFSDRTLYAKALSCFYYVLVALEAALDEALTQRDPDVLKFEDVLTGGLFRAAGFREDLQYFLGEDWETKCSPKSAALLGYEQHLAHLARLQPRLLLAHSYTQHLAIASGGQIIRRWARKFLELPDDKGTAAFEFSKGESSNTLRSKYKSQMDKWGSGLSGQEVQQLIDEHVAAFRLNNGIIRAFPIPLMATARGLLRVTPLQVLLALVAIVVLLVALAVPWVVAGLRQASA